MNRPDEIAALADELDACARNPGRDSTECAVEGELLRRVAAALRASATSPGDAVREALKKLRSIHGGFGKEYEEVCAAQPNNAQLKMVLAAKRGAIQQAISILAALAPAEKAGDGSYYASKMGDGGAVMHTMRGGIVASVDKFDDAKKIVAALNATPTPPSADVADHTPTSNSDVAEALTQAFEYFDNHADVIDGDYGVPEPNREMRLAQMCEDALDLIQSAAPGGATEGGEV